MDSLKTGESVGHAHRVYVDHEGWGVTDYAYARNERHSHRVDHWRVVPAVAHDHDLKKGGDA